MNRIVTENNASVEIAKLGAPRIGTTRLMEWIAAWVMRGGRSLGKPTHFESRDGRF